MSSGDFSLDENAKLQSIGGSTFRFSICLTLKTKVNHSNTAEIVDNPTTSPPKLTIYLTKKESGILIPMFTSDFICDEVVAIVVVKRKDENPLTEEPIVFAYGTFSRDDVNYEIPNVKGMIGNK